MKEFPGTGFEKRKGRIKKNEEIDRLYVLLKTFYKLKQRIIEEKIETVNYL